MGGRLCPGGVSFASACPCGFGFSGFGFWGFVRTGFGFPCFVRSGPGFSFFVPSDVRSAGVVFSGGEVSCSFCSSEVVSPPGGAPSSVLSRLSGSPSLPSRFAAPTVEGGRAAPDSCSGSGKAPWPGAPAGLSELGCGPLTWMGADAAWERRGPPPPGFPPTPGAGASRTRTSATIEPARVSASKPPTRVETQGRSASGR